MAQKDGDAEVVIAGMRGSILLLEGVRGSPTDVQVGHQGFCVTKEQHAWRCATPKEHLLWTVLEFSSWAGHVLLDGMVCLCTLEETEGHPQNPDHLW